MDVNRPTFEHRSTDVPRRDDRSRFDGRNWSKPGRQSQRVAIDEVDLDVIGAAKSGRSLRDCVKNRLQIGRRTGDDPEDLARRRLLLDGRIPRTPQLFILGPQLRVRRVSDDGGTKWSPAREAELGVRRIVLLATGTSHTGAS